MIVEIFRKGKRPDTILGYFYYRRAARGGAKQKFFASVEWAVRTDFSGLGFAVNLAALEDINEFPLSDNWTWRKISNGSGSLAKVATCWRYRDRCLVTDFSPNLSFLLRRHWWLIHDVRAALGFKSVMKKRFYRILLRMAKRFVTVSNFTATEITRLRGKEALYEFFPNGVSPRYMDAEATVKTDVDIIAVGQFDRRKSHLLLLKAVSRLSVHYRDLSVVFAGQPGNALLDVINAIKQYGLQNNITIVCDLDDDTILDLYRRSRVSAHCSVYEGFGISVWEGLAIGHSVVASDIPAHREISTDDVIFFESGDIISLEQRLHEALKAGRSKVLSTEVRSWFQTCDDFWPTFKC